MLTQEMLKQALIYNPETGEFRWRYRPEMGVSWNTRYAGQVAGSHTKDWYRKISLHGKQIYASHAAWLYMTGALPPKGMEIDHRDRNPRNDRWRNLRLATKSQNSFNRGLRSTNTSGHVGVSFDRSRQKYVAYIDVHAQHIILGRFVTFEEAVAARKAAERHHHPDWKPQFESGSPTPGFPPTWLCHRIRDCATAGVA